jgi:hypothetical protein
LSYVGLRTYDTTDWRRGQYPILNGPGAEPHIVSLPLTQLPSHFVFVIVFPDLNNLSMLRSKEQHSLFGDENEVLVVCRRRFVAEISKDLYVAKAGVL